MEDLELLLRPVREVIDACRPQPIWIAVLKVDGVQPLAEEEIALKVLIGALVVASLESDQVVLKFHRHAKTTLHSKRER
eukprot:CAMPEP_0170629014 /NCGR_PEP_ID=MMETSP0224-20130122/33063_1 /TAXON_ID=285029 /ORGANISM="Togula jolla, Strain CCCM 725" /LENGTH=78 /DNA_ID=CAMNT_0010956621 /DNA_START=516 /DNA_END=752 /DNA_ORIENTATION=-